MRPFLLLIASLVVFTLAVSVAAQCTQKLADLPAAPELVGFHLGMTKAEVKAYVPQTVFGRTDEFGVSKTTINPYFDPTIDKTKFEDVRSISLDLLDERVTSLWIGYEETYKIQAIDEFVKAVSESLKVTGTWSPWKGSGRQLKCADFQIFVSTIARGPSVRVIDVVAEDTVAARRQAKEERDSAADGEASEESVPEIVGDKKAKIYYLTTCPIAVQISEVNRVLFKSAEDAEKAGFKLAKDCH